MPVSHFAMYPGRNRYGPTVIPGERRVIFRRADLLIIAMLIEHLHLPLRTRPSRRDHRARMLELGLREGLSAFVWGVQSEWKSVGEGALARAIRLGWRVARHLPEQRPKAAFLDVFNEACRYFAFRVLLETRGQERVSRGFVHRSREITDEAVIAFFTGAGIARERVALRGGLTNWIAEGASDLAPGMKKRIEELSELGREIGGGRRRG